MMKRKFALAAASLATIATMAGPVALTVSAQDTDNDVRAETGWQKHEKSFKGKGHAFGHAKRLEGNQSEEKKGRKDFRNLFNDLKKADLSATETAQIHDAILIKQTSILDAMKEKMEAQMTAMETKNAAVLEAWTLEDKDARNAALETAQENAKEDRAVIHSTFRETVKTAYETFTSTLKSILGL